MPKRKADPDSVTQENPLRTRDFKEKINLRLSPEVLEAFRATGPDWQERMDAALRMALENGWLESVEE